MLEPLKEFIKEAAEAAKIARAKNNGKDIAIFAKKVGSNYFLNNKRLEFLPVAPFNLLAAPAPAASQSAASLQMCTIWDDVRTYLTSQIDPQEKTALIAAISYFKKEEVQ